MPTKNPSQKRDELISARKKELLALGYMPGIVDKAMIWAEQCAEGMIGYAQRQGFEGRNSSKKTELANQFLPQYLADCEKYIQSFDHHPGEVKPQGK